MDSYDRRGDRRELRRSRNLYLAAFWRLPSDYYPGINAASKSVFLGETKTAAKIAAKVQAVVTGRLAEGSPDDWLLATDAELQLIAGKYQDAACRYHEALMKVPREQLGSQLSTWLQAKRLMRAMHTGHSDRNQLWRAFQHLADSSPGPQVSQPACRRLRVFAFDPSMAHHLETAPINEVTLEIPWESKPTGESILQKGPIGDDLEVVDCDPASGCFYEPVNLDDPGLLAMDGLSPTEGDPRFHQQMVYAVGMNLIDHFERALGRKALWATHEPSSNRNGDRENGPTPNGDRARASNGNVPDGFVRQLRIYPHALREANAYYSPAKKALLFGYFKPEGDDPDAYGPVFTCLSHDVIAHEMSHALLDGLHPYFAAPSNADVLAFHEAFADIVALFQHFSHSEVLQHEIARTRSDLRTGGMLGQLAQQFGRAIGNRGALRDALGKLDEKGQWHPTQPSPQDLQRASEEPHDRGGVLVAAVFDAFLSIYQSRVADLLRIATQGSGVLAAGALHPDLVGRLASEAAKTSTHFLRLCMRALDYCPPVDITMGDYLRAMITADVDYVRDDRYNYRTAILEGFQRRGIYPHDVRTLSVESLMWRQPRRQFDQDLRPLFDKGGVEPEWRPTPDRYKLWKSMRRNANVVQKWVDTYCSSEVGDELGLALGADAPLSLYWRDGTPRVEVQSVRVARRNTPQGSTVTDLVVEILQQRRGYYDAGEQKAMDDGTTQVGPDEHGDFTFYGGCTLLIDPGEYRIRYAITKHILSELRLEQERKYRNGDGTSLRTTYFGDPGRQQMREPFALLHRTF